MNKKTVWLPAVAVLAAVYGVWHYSPLRYLTRSELRPWKVQSDALKNKHPIIVTKKIRPHTANQAQQTDIPQPLLALKNLAARQASHSGDKKKTLVLQPDGSLAKSKSTAAVAADMSAQMISQKSQAAPSNQEPQHPYSILLASCRLPQSARKVISDYQKVGFTPYVAKVEFENGGVWLRVFAGHYQTRQEALKVKEEHHLSDAIIKKTPYANLIGTFSSQDELMDSLKRIKDLGYSPYVLKSPANKFQLVVGAFITRKGAEKQKSELQSNGISNQIIKR